MKPAMPCRLTIKGGSSSIKFALFELGHSPRRMLRGAVDRSGQSQAGFHAKGLIEAIRRRCPDRPLARSGSMSSDGLGFLGIGLDPARNAQSVPLISTDAGRVRVRVIRGDEERVIANSVIRVLHLEPCGKPGP